MELFACRCKKLRAVVPVRSPGTPGNKPLVSCVEGRDGIHFHIAESKVERRQIAFRIFPFGGLDEWYNAFLHHPAQDDGRFTETPPLSNPPYGGLAQNLAAPQHAI